VQQIVHGAALRILRILFQITKNDSNEHSNDGVTDGTRTHDNRNHNPSHKRSIHAACSMIFWKKT
jgi:hypothetical protein